jgi:hypothetical protein
MVAAPDQEEGSMSNHTVSLNADGYARMRIDSNELAGDLVIAPAGRELVRITAAGDVVLAEGVGRTEAARGFWEAVEQLRRQPTQPASNEEDEYLIERMSLLLAEIAVIVNGPAPANGSWSYADLPEKVRALAQPASGGDERVGLVRQEGGNGPVVYWEPRTLYGTKLPDGASLYTRPAAEAVPEGVVRELYDAASRGFHISETCGPESKYLHISKFRSMEDLHAFSDAWTAVMKEAGK